MAIAALKVPASYAGFPSMRAPCRLDAPPSQAAPGNDHAGPDSTAPCYPIIAALMARAARPAYTPLDCIRLALDAAGALGRDDPVSSVQPTRLQSFDGALYRTGTGAWTILYSDSLAAPDVRFMIAYLLGRQLLGGSELDYVECTNAELMAMPDDDSASGLAYAFASRLLMPLNACRQALPGAVDLDVLDALAERLCLPVHHVARRWLSYTSHKAVLTLKRDGAALGMWASETAFGLRADDLGGGMGVRTASQALLLGDGVGIELAVGPRHVASRAGARQRAAFPI
ncbi:hypothetical protein [Cupriavidus basilensis]|uniref:Uncharacterized protein n=1 Tax=Cupriavidus basilensis TaxID=68895 RepID=A0A643FTZ6_9BURK|nr:hypothetical protein [Cupriavidus basilensis]QOT80084.1 hypothetical protein F7R26_021580 [Cupriavidus basilensis]